MKVFLGNPPWLVDGKYGIRAGSRWPHFRALPRGKKIPNYMPFPFFLAYAAAVVEKEGFETLLVDSIAEGMSDSEFEDKVAAFGPDLYITETSTPSFNYDIRYAERTRELLGKGVTIGLAGPHVSVMKGEILEKYPWVDVLLIGEYELTARELALKIASKQDLKDVQGIVYRNAAGDVMENEPRPLEKDIDRIPWPARHFTPMLNYNDSFCGLPIPSLQLWASRGCPFRCNFCLWPQVMYGGNRYRVRNPVDVVDEIQKESEKYGMKSFYFDDDTFDIGKKRMLKLSEEIEQRNLGLPWGAMARADTIDGESLEAMCKAGLFAIKYGVESASPELLERCGKNLDLQKVEETVRITRSLGIKVHLTFTFGLAGETWKTVRRTVDYAIALDPDSVQFSIVTPFPGTEYYSYAKEKGYLLTEDWSKFDGARQAVIRTDEMSGKDLEDALRYACDRWFSEASVKRVFSSLKGNRWHYASKGLKNPAKAFYYLYTYLKQRVSRRR